MILLAVKDNRWPCLCDSKQIYEIIQFIHFAAHSPKLRIKWKKITNEKKNIEFNSSFFYGCITFMYDYGEKNYEIG